MVKCLSEHVPAEKSNIYISDCNIIYVLPLLLGTGSFNFGFNNIRECKWDSHVERSADGHHKKKIF